MEDATSAIKQRFHLEQFLVRSWQSIRRLIHLVALAFFWLNLWGQDSYRPLRDAFLSYPWRLPKKVIYLFDWLATQIANFCIPDHKSPTAATSTLGELQLQMCHEVDNYEDPSVRGVTVEERVRMARVIRGRVFSTGDR